MALTNGGDTSVLPEESATIIYIGQHETQREESITAKLVDRARSDGFDMMTVPITTPHFQSRVLRTLQEHVDLLNASPTHTAPDPLLSPLLPVDTDLSPELGHSSLIAATSAWIDLGSSDPLIALISRQVFTLEIAYAAFCGINNVLVYGPLPDSNEASFARCLVEALGLGPYLELHIVLPMTGEAEANVQGHLAELAREQYVDQFVDEDDSGIDSFGSWETWNAIRAMCNYSSRLTIALDLPRNLPDADLQSRWYSEPVRVLMFSRTTFLRNPNGFPVLSKPHQQYLTRLLRLERVPWVILADVGPIQHQNNATNAFPTLAEAATAENLTSQPAMNPFLQYMRHLQHNQPPRPPIELFGKGYQDYLQSPLQPLTDNLESVTYEVFEKDPIKYEWYERAIALALKDLSTIVSSSSRPIVVAVVGAGRGPLVSRVLLASRATGVKVQCWAVEKNPNAHCLLQHRNATDPLWAKSVTVVKSDMRNWKGPLLNENQVKVDLFVSELLGSFGDNELSPECLDGAQHLLHPEHGVSIPQSYTAHITPIASPRIYTDILGRSSRDLNMTADIKWEIPYVVLLHQYDDLARETTSADVKPPVVKQTWKFSHPVQQSILDQAHSRTGGSCGMGGFAGGDGNNEHNIRASTTTFDCQHRGVCHGLAGYFESVLYTSSNGEMVELSTNPANMDAKSKDMVSWFPIFFPLKTPLVLPDHAKLRVSMWRQTDDRKVWYEWLVEVLMSDARGKQLKIAMSELHSSRQNGCMM